MSSPAPQPSRPTPPNPRRRPGRRRSGPRPKPGPPSRSGPHPQAAAKVLAQLSRVRPNLAIVLGSGFQDLPQSLRSRATLPYANIPGFPKPRVPGHSGAAHLGLLEQVPVLLLQGRTHYYEGHDMNAVTFPMRALAAFGIRDVVLTNAAGGINRWLRAGDFMLLTDHINAMGANPLRGAPLPPAATDPFLDLTETYSAKLRQLMRAAARASKIRLRQGVYLAVSGPTYETPAEIRVFAKLGADAVGMSTVPEAIVARQCGLGVLGLSCITNTAAGLRKGQPLSHQEVLAMGKTASPDVARLLTGFARRYAETD